MPGTSSEDLKHRTNTRGNRFEGTDPYCEKESEDSMSVQTMGPTMVFLWVWGWVTIVPKTVASLYSDMKNGKLLARFTFLDAMMQFLVAVATSCHPQDDGGVFNDSPEDEVPVDKKSGSPKKVCDGVDVFGGNGRVLRSHAVEAES